MKASKAGPASVRGRVFSLPVRGGALDPLVTGWHGQPRGGIKLKRGETGSCATSSELGALSKQQGLLAKLDGKRRRLATAARLRVRPEPVGEADELSGSA